MAQIGDKIKILYLDDPYVGKQYSGKVGIVTHIDSIGQLHGTWGSIAVVPGMDLFQVIEPLIKK